MGSAPCQLQGLPTITILDSGGTTLPARQTRSANLMLRPAVLAARGGTAWLTLSWSNWCQGKLGSLTVVVRLPGDGTVRGPFNGPPDYDYVPGCVAPGTPSSVQVTQAYSQHM